MVSGFVCPVPPRFELEVEGKKRRTCFRLFFSLAALLWLAKLPISRAQRINAPASPEVAGSIVRTLVYHEIKALTPRGVLRDYPLTSGSGSPLAYAVNSRPSSVYFTNFDGTGTRTVDSFQYPPKLDLSCVGSTQRWTVATQSGWARGEVVIGLVVDGQAANIVRVSFN